VSAQEADVRGLVAHNDVIYLSPARQGWQGLPLGNGTLGAQAWNPEGLSFQLNTPLSGVYGGGLARLNLHPAASLLSGMTAYKQRLSLYDATLYTTIKSPAGEQNVTCFTPATDDALVCQYRDDRQRSKAVSVELVTWRPTAQHQQVGNVIVVTDTLKTPGQPDYRFALALTVEGAPATPYATAGVEPASGLRVEGGPLTVWVAVAASRDPQADVAAQAQAKLAALQARGFKSVQAAHAAWWEQFWSKSYLKLTSADGVADYLANLWYMHLYAMGAGSRGEVPPKFNGGLWLYEGDQREWGSAYWHWNTQETYWPLYAANHLELLRPYYDMYFAMLPTVQKWTREYYGPAARGAQFQETIPFDGAMALGERVAGVHPRLLVPREVNATNQIYSSSAEIAMQFWWNYQYTGDVEFLRTRAYPLMESVGDFFLSYLEKDAQGVYNMYPSSGHETFHNKLNATTDLAAIRYLFPTLLQASEILGVDAELRPVWQEHLDHLARYGINPATGAITPYYLQPDEKLTFENAENPEIFPIGVFPLIRLGTPDLEIGRQTFYHRVNIDGYGWTTDSIAAARLGLAEAGPEAAPPGQAGVAKLMPLHAELYQDHPSGLQDYYDRTPAIHPYLEGSGTLATGIGEMLLQSWDGVIRVCPALPQAWSADFKLLARGGFEVTGHADKGQVIAIELLSTRGGPAQVVNPWGGKATVVHNGQGVLTSADPVLSFPTQTDQRYLIVPFTRSALPKFTVTATPNDAPKHLSAGSKRWLGLRPGEGQGWTPPVEPNAPQPPTVGKVDRPANPPAPAMRFATAPKLDGELNEPDWQKAPSLGPFLLLRDHNPATQQTDVRVGYDDDNLYLGITAWEAEMTGVLATYDNVPQTHDAPVYQDDSLEVMIVPPGQTPWHFALNPLSAHLEARGWTPAGDDKRFNPEWRVVTSRHSNRWIAEIAIPFRSLAPEGPFGGPQWRFNVGRNEKPQGELSTWAPLPSVSFFDFGGFGHLQFVDLPPAPPPQVADPSLIGHWDFAHLRGPWVLDSSGHGHAALMLSPMKTEPGKFGPALRFDGSSFLDVTRAPDLNVGEALTLAVWVNPSGKAGVRLIDKGPAGGSDGYLLDTYPANNLRVITNRFTLQAPSELPVDQWSHVAVTYRGGAARVYLNGQIVAEQTGLTGPLSTTELPLRIGADSDGFSRFSGLLEDVRLYNRALTSEEIQTLLKGQ
jgi:hypothetical protein